MGSCFVLLNDLVLGIILQSKGHVLYMHIDASARFMHT